MQRVDDLAHRLELAPGGVIARWERRAGELAARLAPAVKEALARADGRVQRAARSLELLNPYSVLERGYSITSGEDGRVVRDAAEVRSGERLVTRLASGTVESVAV